MALSKSLNPLCYQEFILQFMEAYINELLKGVCKRTRSGRKIANIAMWRLLLMNSRTASVFKNASIKFLLMAYRKKDYSIFGIWAKRMEKKFGCLVTGLFDTTINNNLIIERFFGRQVQLSPKVLKFWFDKDTLPLFYKATLSNRTADIHDILQIDAISTWITIIRSVDASKLRFDYSQLCQRELEINCNTRALQFIITLLANLDLTHPRLEFFSVCCTYVEDTRPDVEVISDDPRIEHFMDQFEQKPKLDVITKDLIDLIPKDMKKTVFRFIFVFEEGSEMTKHMTPSYTPFYDKNNVAVYYVNESQLLYFRQNTRDKRAFNPLQTVY